MPRIPADADETWDLGAAPAPVVPELVARRYARKTPLGRGASGTVWRAEDTLRGEDVALKLVAIDPDRPADTVRRELVALRWLRLPGIARLRDEGPHEDRWFIVTDLVEGSHFPGGRTTWEALRPLVLELLDILGRLHAAGIVHRDLKPDNVLVDGSGRVTVVDFGVATGSAGVAEPRQRFAGTPRYASPEQCAGQPTDGRSDLYALGTMVHEILAGHAPHEAAAPLDILARRRSEPAPSLAVHRPDLPPRVLTFVDALLARRPRERPADAEAARRLLAGPRPVAPLPGVPRRATSWRNLMPLFHGPDRFLHLRTDAARELWRRTGGHPRRVRQELDAWAAAGLAHLDGARWRVERRALEQLAGGQRLDPTPVPPPRGGAEQAVLDQVRLRFPDARPRSVRRACALPPDVFDAAAGALIEAGDLWVVRGRWFAGAELNPVPHWSLGARLAALEASRPDLDTLVARARRLVEAVDPRRAAEVLRTALAQAVATGPHRVPELLVLRACVAQQERTLPSCNEALYLLDRYRDLGGDLDAPERLVRATRAQLQGEADRAEALLAAQVVLEDPLLDLAWHRTKVQVEAMKGQVALGELLQRLESWSNASALRRSIWLGWVGMHHYYKGEFSLAADLCMSAAEGISSGGARLSAEIDAAGALLECGRHSAARSMALRASRRARRLRRPREEAISTFIARTADYRGGRELRCRPSLVTAADSVSKYASALLAFNEAGVAWRSGDPARTLKLARFAARGLSAAGARDGARLALALAAACGCESAGIEQVVASARAVERPEIAVQILAFARLRDPESVRQDEIDKLWRLVPMERRKRRLDLMSVDEAQTIQDLGWCNATLSASESENGTLRTPEAPHE